MIGMKVEVESDGLQLFLDKFPRQTSIAMLRAVKRGTMAARTEASRRAASDTGLRVSAARKRITMVPPNGATLEGQIRVSLKRIPLIEFGARGPNPSRGRGRVTVKSQGGRKTVPGAFIATMPGGHTGVYKRTRASGPGRRGKPPNRSQLPIVQLRGPSIGRVVDNNAGEIMAKGASVTEKELNRQLDRIFGRSSRG